MGRSEEQTTSFKPSLFFEKVIQSGKISILKVYGYTFRERNPSFSIFYIPYHRGSTLLSNEFAPKGANSFLEE